MTADNRDRQISLTDLRTTGILVHFPSHGLQHISNKE